jgi:PAS domain S-box-containing protein
MIGQPMVELYSKNLFIADVLDAVASLIVITSPTGRIVHCNRAFQLCTGYSLQETRGEVCWDLLSAQQEVEETRQVHARLLSSCFPLTFRTRMATRAGGYRNISWSGRALPAPQEIDRSIILTGTDVTETGQREPGPQQDHERPAAELKKVRLIEQVGRQGAHLAGLSEQLLEAQKDDNEQNARELREQMRRSLAALNLSVYLVRGAITGDDVCASTSATSDSDDHRLKSRSDATHADLARLSPREL